MKTKLLKGITLGLLVSIASPLGAQTAAPVPQADPPVGEELGYGMGSVLANVVYMPAKVVYASLGLLTGGLGFLLTGGRADVANNIIYPSVKGNYVVTPSHLKGTDPLYFVGPGPELPPENYAAGPAEAPKP